MANDNHSFIKGVHGSIKYSHGTFHDVYFEIKYSDMFDLKDHSSRKEVLYFLYFILFIHFYKR